MRTTLDKLKQKLKARTSVQVTGLRLSESNPFWANHQQLKYMREAVVAMYHEGLDSPSKKYEVSDVQLKKLNDMIEVLESRYLYG